MAHDSPGPLFDWTPPPASPPKHGPDVQRAELARALSALEKHIMSFLRERMHGAPGCRTFHMSTLLEHVQKQTKCAPDSPRRVMRELEAQGCCQVVLLNRRLSLYEVVAISEEGA